MEYSNPEIPEGINTTREHPLKEFLILAAGILGTIVVVVFILGLLAERLVVYIPFSVEQDLASRFESNEEIVDAKTLYLHQLVGRLVAAMDLPSEMAIKLHVLPADEVNAFATLGGHIFIYQGLIDRLPTENALAMVLAHEIAHIKHRDPVVAMGRGVVIGLFLTTIAGLNSDALVGKTVFDAGAVTLMSFSRAQERAADYTALRAVGAVYGHGAGVKDLFEVFLQLEREHGVANRPQFLSTHPLSAARIDALDEHAADFHLAMTGSLTPLPASTSSAPITP